MFNHHLYAWPRMPLWLIFDKVEMPLRLSFPAGQEEWSSLCWFQKHITLHYSTSSINVRFTLEFYHMDVWSNETGNENIIYIKKELNSELRPWRSIISANRVVLPNGESRMSRKEWDGKINGGEELEDIAAWKKINNATYNDDYTYQSVYWMNYLLEVKIITDFNFSLFLKAIMVASEELRNSKYRALNVNFIS